ncbi:MAG: hypothetical protein EBZ47_06210 [Chlamydiae bacterium]|nr:hypothetical protein [Chlamydiota bacterium]
MSKKVRQRVRINAVKYYESRVKKVKEVAESPNKKMGVRYNLCFYSRGMAVGILYNGSFFKKGG